MSDAMTWFGAAMADGLVLVIIGSVGIVLGLASRTAGGAWPFAMGSLGSKLVAWNVAPALLTRSGHPVSQASGPGAQWPGRPMPE